METLLFNKPQFSAGTNYTVRLGDKWDKKVSVGSVLTSIDGDYRFHIISKITCYFSSIPEDVLKYEHDPSCRTYNGLVEGMADAYPNYVIDHTTLVTCLGFIALKM